MCIRDSFNAFINIDVSHRERERQTDRQTESFNAFIIIDVSERQREIRDRSERERSERERERDQRHRESDVGFLNQELHPPTPPHPLPAPSASRAIYCIQLHDNV